MLLNDRQIRELITRDAIQHAWAGAKQRTLLDGTPAISYGLSSFGYDIRLGADIQILIPVPSRRINPKRFDSQLLFVPPFHIDTDGRWFELSLVQQLANVGAEVDRAMIWKKKDEKLSQKAFERGIELLDLTIEDKKNRGGKLKELCRLKEVLGDYFMGDNQYGSTEENWNSYFYFFNAAASAKYF